MNLSNKLHCGDCVDVMQDIDSDSVDCIVTDPPYGLSFMGKDWDKAVPSIAIWQQCLRVLKPGAFAFVMCIPRQDCLARMICRLEDAGFNVAFSGIYWTYATGFPKAQNLSKVVDKRAGVKREVAGYSIEPNGRCRINEKEAFNNCKSWSKSAGFRDSKEKREITTPSTDQAKALDGAYGGFQPKPAVEIILVAMKPLSERTYIDQAISNEHGCTWLDECRIPYQSEKDKGDISRFSKIGGDGKYFGCDREITKHYNPSIVAQKGARFPANVLCEDNVLDNGCVTKSTGGTGVCNETNVFKGTEGRKQFNCGDRGEYSRYFSLDAWFTERIKSLPKEAQKTFPWLIVPKASKSEKNRGLEDISTTHPTVKPIKLMSWLITLASREGDIVLDPFCGSGTTLIAAKMLGRQYIGIEREEDYCEIARKRLSVITEGLSKWM